MGKHRVIAAGFTTGLVVLGACSSSSKVSSSPTTAAGASVTTAGSATSAAGGAVTTTAPSSGSAAVVSVANNAQDGQLLVGSNGHTLYLFEDDKGTTSSCTGGCAAVWPGLTAAAPTGAAGVDQTKLSTATGQVPNQVVYNGHLLYFFSGDSAPGDVKGTGIPHWYPVSPAGVKIDKS